MNRFIDLILAVQFSTCLAWACMIGAHRIMLSANENWQFAVSVLCVFSVLFMLAPYALFLRDQHEEELYREHERWLEEHGDEPW